MAKTNSENGHGMNLGRMATTVTIVESLGPVFQPVHELIQPANMKQYYQDCATAHTAVTKKQDAYDRAVNDRRARYAGLKKLATRVLNAYIDSQAPAADVDDLRGVNKRLQGTRTSAAADPGTDEAAKRKYSTSQQSFVNQADLFNQLITRVEGFPGYRPADEDLKTDALRALHTQLGQDNLAVDAAATALRLARDERDKLFYDADRGMSARRQRLSSYFKSRKDGGNPIKGISFRKPGK